MKSVKLDSYGPVKKKKQRVSILMVKEVNE